MRTILLCFLFASVCLISQSKTAGKEDGEIVLSEEDLSRILQEIDSHEFIDDLTTEEKSNRELKTGDSTKDGKVESAEDFPFRNVSLPWDERVEDLVSRLTLEEITLQMARGGRTAWAPALPNLGINPYPWCTECIRGSVKAGPATAFPQVLGLAATFSTQVIFDMGLATGQEVRAKYNNYTAEGLYNQYHGGLSCFSPTVNIARDPRWGRNQESYGEDPVMTGSYARAYVHGLQGDDPRYVLANAGCKHFAAGGGPDTGRFRFDAQVSMRDLRMTFLPQFKQCVEAGTYSLMCSYNKLNGVPSCANKWLLKDLLRDEWGFNGYVVSDEGAIEFLLVFHRWETTIRETAAAAVNAGVNLNDNLPFNVSFFNKIDTAVRLGLLEESYVREMVKPLFYTRMRLGEFDPPEMNPYSKLNHTEIVQSDEHAELAIQMALKSFVLLKNNGSLFPLRDRLNKVAVVGPIANEVEFIMGNYAPTPDRYLIKTPYEGLRNIADQSSTASGCDDEFCEEYDRAAVAEAVQDSDLIVVCLGTGFGYEREQNDKPDLQLPGQQLLLLQDVVATADGRPVVLLLFNGGPLDISWPLQSPDVSVIVECFFPAQSTGEALRRMFYMEGPSSNPGGRLPMTWPLNLDYIPDITNWTMVNRTYRYYEGDVMFPFGYGLSYSSYSYSNLVVNPSAATADTNVTVTVSVTNNGPYDGEEAVQVYVEWTNRTLPTPNHQLVAFDRVATTADVTTDVTLTFPVKTLNVWDDDDGYVLLPGSYRIYVGGQQPHQQVNIGSNILESTFTIS